MKEHDYFVDTNVVLNFLLKDIVDLDVKLAEAKQFSEDEIQDVRWRWKQAASVHLLFYWFRQKNSSVRISSEAGALLTKKVGTGEISDSHQNAGQVIRMLFPVYSLEEWQIIVLPEVGDKHDDEIVSYCKENSLSLITHEEWTKSGYVMDSKKIKSKAKSGNNRVVALSSMEFLLENVGNIASLIEEWKIETDCLNSSGRERHEIVAAKELVESLYQVMNDEI